MVLQTITTIEKEITKPIFYRCTPWNYTYIAQKAIITIPVVLLHITCKIFTHAIAPKSTSTVKLN